MPSRLASETSPYLRQHADNPVDWYPWGEEALARARREGKPILLSIGYSACHWCHVMAHESFEDGETAEVMNRLFINIKVDREERPDLDQIYQTAHQLLLQRPGGWPLTMFLTPEQVPFFGGTYFPKNPRYGLIGFVPLLERVYQAWCEQRDEIESQNQAMLAALAQTLPQPAAVRIGFDERPIDMGLKYLESQFDPEWGGFGKAPKFPHPADLALLLSNSTAKYRDMALLTLRNMAQGGTFDQLGGGFYRYSVDAQWNIPHFEKMLYDNGALLGLYADAWSMAGDAFYKRIAEMTAAWALREMRSPEGAFYSALDADSEGEEGRYYVWSREEVRRLLSDDQYEIFAAVYGLSGPPNFEGKAWHLRLAVPPVDSDALEKARSKLLAAREQRERPSRDDKILASWNGLMIAGLLRAGRRLQRGDWIRAAQEGLDFIRDVLWRDGRLLAASREKRVHLNAYLDDHAFLLAACLESLQAGFRLADLNFAIHLADALLDRFEDKDAGGFFFTSHDHEELVHRPKIGQDGATPAGTGVAALALQRLTTLTGEERYANAAGRALSLYYPDLQARPGGFASLLAALGEWLQPAPLVILAGPENELPQWQRALSGWRPGGVLPITLPPDTSGLPVVLDRPRQDHVNAWVCEGVKCLPPIENLEALRQWFSRS